MAVLYKAKKVLGKNIYLRDASEEDAIFIFHLRSNEEKNRYLSVTSNRVEDQQIWLKDYSSKTSEAYFVICDNSGEKIGCIRMYSPDHSSYSWGSWLMKNGLGPMFALESVLLLYAYGKYLGFNQARIEVRKLNVNVWTFHERFFSASLLNEDEENRNYIVEGENIDKILVKYRNLISDPLIVIPL